MTQWGLDTLFNPAKRHMDDEKRRLEATREELGDSSGGKRIDLESGRVRINRAESDDADTDAKDARDEAARHAAEKRAERAEQMTDAQKRAAARRRARREGPSGT